MSATQHDREKLATFDKLDAASKQYFAKSKLTERELVAHDRLMYRMALIRDAASPALRKALKARGWQ